MTDLIAGRPAAESAATAADVRLDCKGLLCPLPVYRTSQALNRLVHEVVPA